MASRLSLAARLYSIFALFALLTAAIAVLSDYNTRRGSELTHAIETANIAALNVERVNSLVYAVVMESRGVYMSTEPAVVKKYGEGLLKFNDQIQGVVKRWEAIVEADDADQFATFKKRIEQFIEFRKELVRRANEISPAAGREWGDNDANRSVRSALNKDLEALSKVYAERGKKIAAQAEVNRELSFLLTCLGGVALLLVGIGVVIIARSIARPLSVITATIKQVAEGAENVEVPLRLVATEPQARDNRIRDLLEMVGLGDRANHRPHELSGGEQQRVAIARALANRPDLLLADEPTGQLDSQTGRSVMALLQQLVAKEKVTAIVATHDRSIIDLADLVIELRDGRVVDGS